MEDPLKTDGEDPLGMRTGGLTKRRLGIVDRTCTLCLSKDDLMSPLQSITFQHIDIQYKMTVMELMVDVNMNQMFRDQLKQKICNSCVNTMTYFFLFKNKCFTKPSTMYPTYGIKNSILIDKIPKNETTVKLQKRETPKAHISKPRNFVNCAKCAQHITENGDCEVTHVNSKTSHKCNICEKKFGSHTLTLDHFQNHSFAELGIDGIQRRGIDLFACAKCDLTNLTWKQYVGHIEMHDYERVTQLMVKNLPFCYCCLQNSDRLVRTSEDVFLTGYAPHERVNVAVLLCEVLGTGNMDFYDGAVVCETCLDKTIQAYCFQVTNKKSKETLNNCLMQLENCLQATEELALPQGQSVQIRIHYDLNKTINETDLTSYAMSDASDKIEAPQRRRGIIHTCTVCWKQFRSLRKLNHHRTWNHTQKRCTECHEIINQLDREAHMKAKHSLSKLICNECNKCFYDKKKLQSHIITHKTYESGQTKCSKCSEEFFTHFDGLKHKCLIYKCTDCPRYPCIHEKYIQQYYEDEKVNPKTGHKCLDCGFTYFYKRALIEHANVSHLSHYPYVCPKCGKKMPSRVARYKHYIQEHTNSNQTSKSKSKIQFQKPYKCNYPGCRKKFLSEKEINRHRENHYIKRICALCDLSFTPREMARHKVLAHGIQTVKICDVSCSMCTLNFETSKEREEHEATHTPGTPHLCRICKKSFATRSQRTKHCYSHLKIEKTQKCKFCGETVETKSYPSHVKTHKNDDSMTKANTKINLKNHFMCHVCGKRFSTRRGFQTHMLGHSPKDRNSWICNYCPKSYCSKTVLDMHIRSVHLHPKRYQCELCGKRFTTKSQQIAHKVVHTRERNEQCNICNSFFVTKSALTYHMRLHTGERPYACNFCDEKFLNTSRRMAHIKTKHIGRTEQCTLCTSSFYTRFALKNHTKRHFNPNSSLFLSKIGAQVKTNQQVKTDS